MKPVAVASLGRNLTLEPEQDRGDRPPVSQVPGAWLTGIMIK